jgi:Domain of unknown function (DUF5916)
MRFVLTLYMRSLLPFLPYLFASLLLFAIKPALFAQVDYTLMASKTTKLLVDGRLDEAVWQNNLAITNFTQTIPVDTGLSQYQTVVRLAFDDTYLYVGATCYQPRSSYRVESLKRDYVGGTSDVLNIAINPYRDGVNGFIFAVNPYGVLREALMDNGSNMSFDWDNKWNAEVERHEDYWTIEMAIPFKTLRYKTNSENEGWRVNFVRTMLNPWNVSTWVPVPRPQSPQSLAFSGELKWQESPPPPRRFNTSVIPYAIAKYDIEYQRDALTQNVIKKPTNFTPNLGGDVKISLTPSLNLDLTLNPDFSQVEVDRQVTNLSRFELFFPELRQFFQENRDLFAFWGFPNTRPFFSRRIGLAYNPVLGINQQVPILGGLRLSGKVNNNLRVGLLGMRTKQVNWSADKVLPGANFTVLTLQQKVFARSFLGAVFVNKMNSLNSLSEVQKAGIDAYSSNVGLEYNLFSKDNKWEGEWYYHRSLSPNELKRDHAFAQFLGYTTRSFTLRSGYNHIGKYYTAEAGFVPRPGIQTIFFSGTKSFYPKSSPFSQINCTGRTDNTLLIGGKPTDGSQTAGLEMNMRNGGLVQYQAVHNFTFLTNAFDPTNLYETGSTPLAAGTSYQYTYHNLMYSSSRQKAIYGSAELEMGEYFNGNKQTLSADASYRLQPYGIFTLTGVYNRIKLPAPYPSAQFWIVGPRVELTFTRKLFFNTFVQYNTQANNVNLNMRLQWRFAPVSDFFLVFTDNSWAEGIPNTDLRFLAPKNKAIVAKFTYWY